MKERFVTRWDLDKTYLRTRFDTLSDLLSTALESVEDKRTVPGATAVLRELGSAGGLIHILSGSPRQMRKRLTEKLVLDRVKFHELTLKPNLSNLLSLRFSALRDQLGYKLPELLEAHARESAPAPLEPRPREVLVGDDSESDAFVYSLYADLCAGAVQEPELLRILESGGVREHSVRRCVRALSKLRRADVVDSVLIHLDAQTPPSLFLPYGKRVVPFFNYLQAAFVLLERGFLKGAQVLSIAREFLERHGFTADVIARSYGDLCRRGHARGTAPALLHGALDLALDRAPVEDASEWTSAPASLSSPFSSAAPSSESLSQAVREMLAQERPRAGGATREASATADADSRLQPPFDHAPLDYRALAEVHRHGRNRRKPGQRFH